MGFQNIHLTAVNTLKRNPTPAILVCVFLISVIIKSIGSMSFNSPWIFGDEVTYFLKAKVIFTTHNLFALPVLNNAFPGYPLLLSICFSLSHSPFLIYHSMLLLNIFLTSVSVFPVYFILRKYCPGKIPIAGSIIVLTLPVLNVYSYSIMSENLFIPLFIFSCWFFIEYREQKSRFWGVLFLFSLILLLLTRPTGFVMAASALIVFFYDRYEKFTFVKKGWTVVLGLIVFIMFFLMTRIAAGGNYFIFVYNISDFSESILQAIGSTGSLLRLGALFLYQIEYLILSGYFIFFLLSFVLLLFFFHGKNSDSSKYWNFLDSNRIQSLKSLVLYVTISAFLLILISVFFNYWAETRLFLNGTNQFEVYGRYIDATVPLIFILGIISASLWYNLNKKPDNAHIGMIIGLEISVILLFFMTFPLIIHDQYMIANNLSIWYLMDFKNLLPIGIQVAVLFSGTLILFLSGFYSQKLRILFFLVIVVMSSFFSFTVMKDELSISNHRDFQNQMGKFIVNNSDENSIILIDSSSNGDMDYIWLALFLTNGHVQFIQITNESTQYVAGKDQTMRYLISSKELGYPKVEFPIATSTGGYTIYNLNTTIPKSFTNVISDGVYHKFKYIWLEAEGFSGITSHESGWGLADAAFTPCSNQVILSGSNSPGNSRLSKQCIVQTNETYNIWLRSYRFNFADSRYVLSIDNEQNFTVIRQKQDRNSWEWIKISNVSLTSGNHAIHISTMSGDINNTTGTWEAIDQIFITNNLSYIPVDGEYPPND